LPQLLVGERVLEGLLVLLRAPRVRGFHELRRRGGAFRLLALVLRLELDHHHLSPPVVAAVRPRRSRVRPQSSRKSSQPARERERGEDDFTVLAAIRNSLDPR
uniref:Uncharacterized protein n=1 Tax=Aegilops tauschii subsp. strangulata TaxID=200361 RepID=A0A453LHR2_AEGTS